MLVFVANNIMIMCLEKHVYSVTLQYYIYIPSTDMITSTVKPPMVKATQTMVASLAGAF